jgi:hypothetical protein
MSQENTPCSEDTSCPSQPTSAQALNKMHSITSYVQDAYAHDHLIQAHPELTGLIIWLAFDHHD